MLNEGSPLSSQRRHYLDQLRIWLLFLVFLTHCAMPFVAADRWHITNKDTSFVAEGSIGFCYQWGLQLFFLVCGASAGLSLRRRNASRFIKERFFRLAVPYAVGVAVLVPFQLYFEYSQRGKYHGTLLAFYDWFYRNVTIGWRLKINFDDFHLWFLRYLFEYSLLSLPLFLLLSHGRGQRIYSTISKSARGGGIWLLVVPVALIRMVLRVPFPGHEDWSTYGCWLVFYMYGYILSGDRALEKSIVKHAPVALSVGVSCLTYLSVLCYLGPGQRWELHPTYSGGYFLYEAVSSLDTCAWAYFFLGMGVRFLDVAPRWLGRTGAIVLPFYVLHHAVIIAVAYYVVQLHASILTKYLLISLPSLVVTLVLCQFVVTPVPVLRLFLGMKTYRAPNFCPESESAT